MGHALVRELLRSHRPRGIRIYARGELKLATMRAEMRREFPACDVPISYLVGDVRDRERLYRACEGVDAVLHLAALKRVEVCEENPFEAVQTNVLGAQNVINAATDCGAGRVLAISSDKAVNPLNLYGATKLCAEKMFLRGATYSGGHGPQFGIVRYGNVLASRGSVVHTFREQAARGGPLTITDRQMTRFWITLPRVARFILDRLEDLDLKPGCIAIPKMPSMRITEMATAIAPVMEQRVIGYGRGEKLHECLITWEEAERSEDCGDHYLISPHGALDRPALAGPYSSDCNDDWLDAARLAAMMEEI